MKARTFIHPGQVFGRLTAVREVDPIPKHHRWECTCECGRTVIVTKDNLTRGNSKSCGKCEKVTYTRDGDTVIGTMLNGKSFLIDVADFEKVSQYNWGISGPGYCSAFIDGKQVLMHRFLMGDEGEVIDHINGDKLDNRRSNLRRATARQNTHNSRKPSNNTSGVKGVWKTRNNKYCAEVAGKKIGYFNTAEEAARKYDEKARELFGEFARLNFA